MGEWFERVALGALPARAARRCPVLRRVIGDESAGATGVPGVLSWTELLARGDGVSAERLEEVAAGVDPDSTAAACSDDGWFRIGDRVLLHEDGSIRFLGRYRDVLKVGGENVDPFEVEAFLNRHPAVAQAQVVGAPDARLSEVPVAFVILRPGRVLAPEEPRDFCRGRITGFKIPHRFFPVDEFPMTASGKVRRFRLRERAAEWIREPEAPRRG